VPELPELQAHAERLAEAVGGRVLERFEPLTFSVLKTADVDPAEAVGAPLLAVRRRGKHLVLQLAPCSFVVHLMQGGRLHVVELGGPAPRSRGAIARWHLEGGWTLVLTEAGTERRAGVWVVRGTPEAQPPLAGLGPDADAATVAQLTALLAVAGGARLHGVLRDQQRIAGIGRLLANDICHEARLSPFASCGKLDAGEVRRLHDAIGSVIAAALEQERQAVAIGPSMERRRIVHGRAGEPCPRCADVLRAVTYRTHEIVYCATCQTGGRVLKDNTTSRFLK
jgi:formamidopyrimidine-DNA glycosylase